MTPKQQAGARVLFAYAIAVGFAAVAGWFVRSLHPLLVIAVADLVGTIVIFVFSRIYDNSSFYDPYWSVAPPVILAYLVLEYGVASERLWLVAAPLLFWAVRLTFNWWRRWKGLFDEDWRYRDYRTQTGRLYWLVSFFGFHLFPTLLVYLGCFPLWWVTTSSADLNLLDGFALAICIGAAAVEMIADRQLHVHATSDRRGEILDTGLWGYSRHPNYLGELMLWWGLGVFAAAAGAGWPAALGGAVAITALFVFVSIPLVERRAKTRRGESYLAYARRTSVLLPWPPKRAGASVDTSDA